MIDPTSFGTALTTLAVVVTMVIAFGCAVLSDMALRRREDRTAARDEGSTRYGAPARARARAANTPAPSNGSGPTAP